MNWDGLDIGILGPAALAGLIVLATHVPLGTRVLARGIIFIDLAIAQIAALGVVIAQYFGMDEHGFGIQVAAATAALLGAALLNATDKRWPEFQEPLIGTLFVLAASGGILALANNPHGGEHLKDLLIGQILWVSPGQLWTAAIASVVLVAMMLWRGNRLDGLAFYALFALSITVSVQLIGVYLVFASLIVPALATVGMRGRNRLLAAYSIGLLGYVSGLALSALLDLPSGAMIVWTLAACGALVRLLLPAGRVDPAGVTGAAQEAIKPGS